MPAYIRMSLPAFLDASPSALLGELERGYTRDGFATLYSQQTKAWDALLPLLQAQLRSCLPNGGTWSVLLEFPLYRLRKRIDAVILTGDWIIVLEVKLGATAFLSPDLRQVEDYALDLRDFHAAVVIVLCCRFFGARTPRPFRHNTFPLLNRCPRCSWSAARAS